MRRQLPVAVAVVMVVCMAIPVLGSDRLPGLHTPPYLDSEDGIAPSTSQVNIGVHKATIRLRGTSGEGTTMAYVQVKVEGKGDAEAYVKPQQTVLLIDDSGSMTENDPSNDRLIAARNYISQLNVSRMEEVAVTRFSDIAQNLTLMGLTQHYEDAKAAISLNSEGSTNMRHAFILANNELIPKKKPGYSWNYILLTDGCWNTGGSPQMEVNKAEQAQVRIFTIGLGEDTGNCNTGLDSSDLRGWSTQTDGKYYAARDATDLYSVYKQIAKDIRDVAGYAPSGTPMLRIQLTQDIEVVPGSFDIIPSRPTDIKIGNKGLSLEWDKPATRLKIGEELILKFSIQSYRVGKDIPVMDANASIMQYLRTDSTAGSDGIDQLYVDVFKPPEPGGDGGGGGGGGGGIIPPFPPITQENLALGAIYLFPLAIVLVLIFLLFIRRRRRIQEEIQKAKEEEERKRKAGEKNKKKDAAKKVAERHHEKRAEEAPKPIL